MSRRLIIRPQDLHGDDLVPRIVRHLTEEIKAAEDVGDSQNAESLLMDLNIIMELALGGGDVQKAIDSLEVGELRNQVLDIRDQIAVALKNNDAVMAARLRTRLWELLDAAWQARSKLRPAPSPQHEHVSTSDFDKRMK